MNALRAFLGAVGMLLALAACTSAPISPEPEHELGSTVPAESATAKPAPTPEPVSTPIGGGTGLIAFSSPRQGDSTIYTVSIETGEVSRVSEIDSRLTQPTWSPDGQRIGYVHWSGGAELDIWFMDLAGEQRTRVTSIFGRNDTEPSWSPDGERIVFASSRNSYLNSIGDEVFVMNLYMVDLRTLRQVQLTEGDSWDTDPDWSPDSQQLVWQGERMGNNEILQMSLDGSDIRNLTRNPASDANPAWSPDGTRIAFVSDRDGNEEIYVMGHDGSNPQRLTHNPERDKAPAWSPDGEWLAYQAELNRNFDIVIMRADGTEARQLTHDLDFDGFPAWQPAANPLDLDPLTPEVDQDQIQEYISFRTMAWIGEHAVPLLTREAVGVASDLQPLVDAVGESMLVDLSGLGLGTREDFILRHRLIELLTSQLGFDTLVLEIGRGAGQLLDDYVRSGTGDPVAAIEAIPDPSWHSGEFLRLIEWVRARNASGSSIRIYGVGPSESWLPVGVVEAQIKAIQSGQIPPGEHPFQYLEGREQALATDSRWVIEQLDQQAKLIAWGNHIELALAARSTRDAVPEHASLGTHLGRSAASEPFSIGLAYYRGSMIGYPSLEAGEALELISLPVAPPGSFEWMGAGTGLRSFLIPLLAGDDSMLDRPLPARALLYGDSESMLQPVNLVRVYDALIFLDQVQPATPLTPPPEPGDSSPATACLIESLCVE